MPVTALALAGLITCAPGYDRAAYERVATLWPKASIRTMKVGGKAQKVIAPITRKGVLRGGLDDGAGIRVRDGHHRRS